MEYSSFYGGRKGSSFVIVKRYNTIEAMVTDFAQGNVTTNEVNYGEYVIINSLDKNSIENGCVYQRGLNSNAQGTDPIEDPGAGAKFIGQICGPDGKIRDLSIVDYDDTVETKGEYTPSELVSGKTHDSIKYSWVNVKDENGNVTEYQIGFQFPYTVIEFTANPASAYTPPGEELAERIDDGTFPFYEQWHINVPRGKKGDSFIQMGIFPTIIPPETQYYDSVGSGDSPSGEHFLPSDVTGHVNISEYRPSQQYIKFTFGEGQIGYAIASQANYKWELHYGVLLAYYNTDPPEFEQFDIGEYRVVHHAELDETGKLSIWYKASNPNASENNPDELYIRTLRDVQVNTTGDQKIYTYQYNNGVPEEQGIPISDPINYILEMAIKDDQTVDQSNLLVRYSDPLKRGNVEYDQKNDWLDLGNIKGSKGDGTRTIGAVASVDDLYRDPAKTIPIKPEEFKAGCEGWCMTVGLSDIEDKYIYAFNYLTNSWYLLGGISPDILDVTTFIVVQESIPSNLNNNGIQLSTKTRKSI